MRVNLHHRLSDYELLDSGNGRKLERFGKYVLDRPEPGSNHRAAMPEAFWKSETHARFTQTGRTSGKWENLKNCPDSWMMPIDFNKTGKLKIELRLSGFKHIGVFPEQVLNWDYVLQRPQKNAGPTLLNLFGYTGVMSLVAAKVGYNVTHVEALKQLNQWGKENMLANKLDGIRWISDDAVKFCEKENRRNRKYDVVVLDPPAFGVAKKSKPWQMQKDIYPLMNTITNILKPDGEVILNMYARNVDVDKLCHKISEQTGLLIHTNQHIRGVSDHGASVDHGFMIRMNMP
jgi:23S rRNA (cytosine1962-C5)-methyltransferase